MTIISMRSSFRTSTRLATDVRITTNGRLDLDTLPAYCNWPQNEAYDLLEIWKPDVTSVFNSQICLVVGHFEVFAVICLSCSPKLLQP